MEIQVSDLITLLQAIEAAYNKKAFSELEVAGFKPSFDKVHNFLNSYKEQAEAQSKAMTEQKTIDDTATTVETVQVDTVADTTKVGTKAKKAKKA